MRIALVYRSFHLLGSLARETVELARHLSQRHEVHVFSIAARTDPTLAPECTFHDVPVETLGDGVHFSVRELMAFRTTGRRNWSCKSGSTWCTSAVPARGWATFSTCPVWRRAKRHFEATRTHASSRVRCGAPETRPVGSSSDVRSRIQPCVGSTYPQHGSSPTYSDITGSPRIGSWSYRQP